MPFFQFFMSVLQGKCQISIFGTCKQCVSWGEWRQLRFRSHTFSQQTFWIKKLRKFLTWLSKNFKPIPILIFLLLLLCVDEVDRLKHQQNGVNNKLVQKCFVFLKRQRKWTGKQRQISTTQVFKSKINFVNSTFRLLVRSIKAFSVKLELHNVAGYVYSYKRAAGGSAQFFNFLVNLVKSRNHF